MRFEGKVVLVTGSSRGIGRAIALKFAEEGAKVVVNYSKSEDEAREVVDEINEISEAVAFGCDVSDEREVEEMIEKVMKRLGKIDVLVNNVGDYIDGDEWDGESEIWERTLRNNLISVMNVSKYVSKIFLEQGFGDIVNIASMFSFMGSFDSIAYAASKSGVVSVSQAYCRLLSGVGRVNAVSPGAVRAGYWLRAPEDELKETVAGMLNGRLIEPKEVADVVLDLADSDCEISGDNILVDGKGNYLKD